MARRNKPYDPAASTRERKERAAEVARLQSQGATVKVDRAGRIITAYRSNVFNLLLTRGTITPNQYDAAYRLSLDWAAWKGLEGKPEQIGAGSGSAELVSDRMINAGRRVESALSTVDPVCRYILEAFMEATVEEDRPMSWRGIMQKLGWTNRERQTELVIQSVEQLRAHYQEPRRAAA